MNPNSRDRLIRLGILLSFDMFVNNYDRVPFLWNNEGNPSNLLLQVQTNFLSKGKDMVDRDNLTFDFLDFVAVDTQMMNIDVSKE